MAFKALSGTTGRLYIHRQLSLLLPTYTAANPWENAAQYSFEFYCCNPGGDGTLCWSFLAYSPASRSDSRQLLERAHILTEETKGKVFL